jgi:hypothetical protein
VRFFNIEGLKSKIKNDFLDLFKISSGTGESWAGFEAYNIKGQYINCIKGRNKIVSFSRES